MIWRSRGAAKRTAEPGAAESALVRIEHEIDALRAALPTVPTPGEMEAADAVAAAVGRLLQRVAIGRIAADHADDAGGLVDSRLFPAPKPRSSVAALTRSGIFDGAADPMSSCEFPVVGGDMIGRLAPDTFRWLDSTPAEQRFLGWTLDRLRSMSFLDIVHPDHRELAREQLGAARVKGEAHGLIYRIRTASGEAKAIEVNVATRYTPDGTIDHLRCHVADVSERLRASRELRKRTRDLLAANGQLVLANRELSDLKDRYADLYHNAPAMYASLDATGAIRECNDTLARTLGYRRDQLVGQPYVVLVPEWHRPAFAAYFAQFLATGAVDFESQWLHADGRPIDVHVTASADFDADGRITRSRALARDITATKVMEAQIQENSERLARAVDDLARKNRELDDFSHSVSHDLQEPLRTLTGFSEILLSDYGDRLDGEGRDHLRYVLDASKRMRSLVKDLLALSRSGRAADDFGPIDLGDVLGQVRSDLAATIADRSAVVAVADDLPPAWGDRDRVARLLANLVGNALKYVKPGHPPRVEIAAEAGPGGSVAVSVRDHGIGIDPKHHERIFGLFRRLHCRDEYEGTGAGLAICRKIAEAHGGRITVQSEVGEGATFRVHLPGPG